MVAQCAPILSLSLFSMEPTSCACYAARILVLSAPPTHAAGIYAATST